MASRILHPSSSLSSSLLRTAIFRQTAGPSLRLHYPSTRAFGASRTLKADTIAAAAPPVRRPVGAFRGGVFGFLLGSTLAGAGTWFYIMEEYRVSNELLTEDIYALQAAVQRIHSLVVGLEEKVTLMEMKNEKK